MHKEVELRNGTLSGVLGDVYNRQICMKKHLRAALLVFGAAVRESFFWGGEGGYAIRTK